MFDGPVEPVAHRVGVGLDANDDPIKLPVVASLKPAGDADRIECAGRGAVDGCGTGRAKGTARVSRRRNPVVTPMTAEVEAEVGPAPGKRQQNRRRIDRHADWKIGRFRGSPYKRDHRRADDKQPRHHGSPHLA